MRLGLGQDSVELEFDNCKKATILPRLYLDAPRFIISEIYERYQHVHLEKNICGSLRFLDIENELDALVFTQNNFELVFLELGFPFDIALSDNVFKKPSIAGKMRIKALRSFDLFKTNYGFYNKVEDLLIIQYKNDYKNYDLPLIEIAKDFFVVHHNGSLIGWGLRNCCKYICEANGTPNRADDEQSREVFANFLAFFKEDTFEKMEQRDLELKLKLETLKDTARKSSFYAISEVLEEWLNDNY